MDAMMYVIVTENLHDRDFIQRYTTGFDEDTMPEGVPANESLMAYLSGAKMAWRKRPSGQRKSLTCLHKQFGNWRATTQPPNPLR